jgi:glutamine synthetase
MHLNVSMEKDGKNLFYDPEGSHKLSEDARLFIAGILERGEDICLASNSSVNAYRRLDPNFEAPNEIKVHDSDRGSMIRIPLGNEKSSRMEMRSVAPDSNPYLLIYLLYLAGEEGRKAVGETREKLTELLDGKQEVKKLPGSIQDAISAFEKSEFTEQAMGPETKAKFIELKQAVADRSPKLLGTRVKKWEILDHHAVRNQELSKDF